MPANDQIVAEIILDILSDGKEWQGPALRHQLSVRGIRQPTTYFVRQTQQLKEYGHITSEIRYSQRGHFGCKAKVFQITESGKAAHGSANAACDQVGG